MIKGRISARFRYFNIILFLLAIGVTALVMLMSLSNIIIEISTDYAKRYAVSAANTLSANISEELKLIEKAARSRAVIEWLIDEEDNDKRDLAFEEMSGIIEELYSTNLYIGIVKTLNEYKVEKDYNENDIKPFAVLDRSNPDDEWFFGCIESDRDYTLDIGIDHVLDRKRVWLDYKIVHNGLTLGVICTGLEFSHVAREIFSQIKDHDMRGLIIDGEGIVYMDSLRLHDEDFLNYDFETRIEEEFQDPIFVNKIKENILSGNEYFDVDSEPVVLKLQSGPYGYAAIAPIAYTDWLGLILYDPSASLNMSLFLPVFAIMLILLIIVAAATNMFSHRFIFKPLDQLIQSLPRLKENREERIYGLDRNDEFGNLANTIQDLFTKANYDALTGIYNRRFMENNIQHFMEFLSRSNGLMSVLMVDVDYFKLYNDTYGHDQGDVCLTAIAQTFAKTVPRTNDFVARYGGEEFIAILPNTGESGARLIAEKLLENIKALSIPHAKNTVADCVTVSVGLTSGRVSYSQSWEEYVKRADEALYMSKKNGRNQFTYLKLTE